MEKQMTTLDDLLNAYSGSSKKAEAPSLPDNHPATGMDDARDVPSGSLIPDGTAPLIEEFGKLNPDAPSSPQNEKEHKGTESIGTETGKVEDGLAPVSELKDGIKDPGPDAGHPASTDKADKYASFTDVGQIATDMAKSLNDLTALLEKTAAAPAAPATPAAPAAPKVDLGYMHPEQRKIAEGILQVTQANPQVFTDMVRSHLEPFVEVGISRAAKLAEFMDMAASDPAGAEAMLGMGGGDPSGGAPAGGGDPMAAAGGGDAAAGGDADLNAVMGELQSIADQSGLTLEQVIDELESLLGGAGGDAGAGGDPSGGAPGGSDAAPPAPEAAGGGDSAPPPSDSSAPGEEKTAAAPSKKAVPGARKEAHVARGLLTELLHKTAPLAR